MSMRIGFGLRMTDNKGAKAGGGGGSSVVNHAVLSNSGVAPGANITLPFTPTPGNFLIVAQGNNGNPQGAGTGWTLSTPDNSAQSPSGYVGASLVYRIVQPGDTATYPAPMATPGSFFPAWCVFVWEIKPKAGITTFAGLKQTHQYYENTSSGASPAANGWPTGTLANAGLGLMAVFRRGITDSAVDLPVGMTQDDKVIYATNRGFVDGHQSLPAAAYSLAPTFAVETNYYSIEFLGIN